VLGRMFDLFTGNFRAVRPACVIKAEPLCLRSGGASLWSTPHMTNKRRK
jgi:hypothetical protein